jgi:3-hydroxyacyl-CoA dehydrogenase
MKTILLQKPIIILLQQPRWISLRLLSSSAAAANPTNNTTTINKPVQRVGIIGAGLMGHGIAQVAAEAGYKVSVLDTNSAALQKGIASVESSLKKMNSKLVTKGTLSEADAMKKTKEVMDRIDCRTDNFTTFAKSGNGLIIEAIIENLQIKRDFYKKLGGETNAILASNTSSFPIGELADASGRASDVCGLHFFNPVQLMPLVEVVSTSKTSPRTREVAMSFVKTLAGKTPVPCKDTPGFIVNRLLVPYLAEAMAMVDRNDAEIVDIDTAMKLGAGHPMGPLYLADYIGLDTVLSILKGWKEKYPQQGFFIPTCLEKLVKEGKLGRKSGQGFYPWGGKQ